MPDGFDKTLRDMAEKANADIDFDALRSRVLKARESELSAPVVKARFSPSRLRSWGLLAACLTLCLAAGAIALRGGIAKGEAAEEPMLLMSAVDSAAAESAAATDAAAPAAMAPPAAQAPQAAQAPPAAQADEEYDMNDAFIEDAPAAPVPAAAEGALSGRAAKGSDDPYALLVNRDKPLQSAEEPSGLVSVDEAELSNIKLKKSGMRAEQTALTALENMLAAAENEGMTGFYLVSAYRSYDEQSAIWARKLANDPSYGQNGEPVSSMPPGESEHQTGLAFDITSTGHPSMSEGYAEMEQAKWLAENAADYGFILRYPKGKEQLTGVVFEPWHYRYVGVDLAKYLTDNGLVLEEA